jgi:hypothetical protein
MLRGMQIGNPFKMDKFKAVYWVIAVATAQHTAWGAATTMQGGLPSDPAAQSWWWVQGLAFAIAIDISMVMVATKVRSGSSNSQSIGFWKLRIPINWYTITFFMVAIFSFYFQLLYAWAHASPLANGGGIASIWVDRLQSLIDARIIIAPFALPGIATLYTIGGLGKGGEAHPKPRNVTQPMQSSRATVANEAIRVDVEPLPQPAISTPLLQSPQPEKMRDDSGKLTGYVCPGCGAELSISGWSRHKKTCQHLHVDA